MSSDQVMVQGIDTDGNSHTYGLRSDGSLHMFGQSSDMSGAGNRALVQGIDGLGQLRAYVLQGDGSLSMLNADLFIGMSGAGNRALVQGIDGLGQPRAYVLQGDGSLSLLNADLFIAMSGAGNLDLVQGLDGPGQPRAYVLQGDGSLSMLNADHFIGMSGAGNLDLVQWKDCKGQARAYVRQGDKVWNLLDAEQFNLNPLPITVRTVLRLPSPAGGQQYATFSSHNQKVISNAHGYFMTYLTKWQLDAMGNIENNDWELAQSTDGGNSWQVLYRETGVDTRAPAIETDEKNNIYLTLGVSYGGPARFLAFGLSRDNEYRLVNNMQLQNGWCDKFCMLFDPIRKQIYYVPGGLNNADVHFYILDLDGQLKRPPFSIVKAGPKYNEYTNPVNLEYPLLSLDEAGTLHMAWTVQAFPSTPPPSYTYRTIRHMLSQDGGLTWQNLSGEMLPLPVLADDPRTECIVSDNEIGKQKTWLANELARSKKIHFLYNALDPQDGSVVRQHYVRFADEIGKDGSPAQPDKNTSPFKGGDIEISASHKGGFFASRSSSQNALLYCISLTSTGDLACLRSEDNGDSWHDHAIGIDGVAEPDIWFVGGSREITSDGYVIGSFTTDNAPKGKVYFFKFLAPLRHS